MKRFLFYATLTVTTLGIIGIAVIIGIYIWVEKDLPNITAIRDYRPKQVTTVYARDNSVLGYFFREKRFLVNVSRMPKHLTNAFLAVEDADFYSHPGVSLRGITRAFVTNIIKGGEIGSGGGGSTITQQLIKQLLLTREKTYERKIKEAILAYRLENYLTKDEILYLYLNHIYLGSGAHGVEAAARTYFGKHVEDLMPAESAVIASLAKTPTDVNPYSDRKKLMERQRWALSRMRMVNFLSEEEYTDALAYELDFHPMKDPSWKLGAYYLEEVRRDLIEFFKEENVHRLGLPIDLYGEDAVYEAGLHVYTAMDPIHQSAAERALREGLSAGYKRSGWHGPIAHLTKEEQTAFLEKEKFSPDNLSNAGWVKALVISVKKEGAEVRFGEYKGVIPVSSMIWARTPNLRQTPDAVRISDATKVLHAGDVVWVSAYGALGTANPVGAPANPGDKKNPVPVYAADKITRDTPIRLSLEQIPQLQGAVSSIEVHTGDLVALVGGYQFSSAAQFNRATQAKRQPGSSFKPVVYSVALDNGFTAGSIIMDTPFELNDPHTRSVWTPKNFDGKFLGPIPLRTALALSRNICTVRVAQIVGMNKVVERAHQLGIQGNIPAYLAVSLGSAEATPLNMTEAYTPFANQGNGIKPRKIISIANSWNEKIVDITPDIYPAISPGNAYLMASLLKDVVNAGTAGRARSLDRPVAGKTGTSNDERDAWFIGFSPYLVTGTWVGYDNNSPIGRMETGGRAALPIFVDYRKQIDSLYAAEDFVMPADVLMVRIDGETGYLASPESSKTYTLPYIRGTEPSFVSGVPIDRGSEEVQSGEDVMKQIFF